MKLTKLLSLLMVAMMAVAMFAACGGSSSSAAPASTATAASTADDSTEPAAGGDSEYDGPEVVMKVAQGGASTGHSGVALINFEERVEARTGGLVDVQPYSDAQLGTETEIAQGTTMGTIEASVPGLGTFASFFDKLQFANTPFLFDNREQSYKFWDSDFMASLNEEIGAETNTVVLGYGENGVRGLSNNTREIKTPDDMKGLKIRVQENPLYIAMITALGASATPISFPELYTALSQKTVDGQDNGIPLTVNNKFYEVQTNYTTLGHCIDQLIFIVNKDWFEALDPTLQTILREEVENWSWDVRQLSIDYDKTGIETMEAAGLVVTDLTPEEQQAFKDLMGPAEDEARKLVGEDFFEEVVAAVADAAKEAEANPSSIVH